MFNILLFTLLIIGCLYVANGKKAKYGPDKYATVPKDCHEKNYCAYKEADYPQQKLYQLFPNLTSQIQRPEANFIEDKFGERDDIDDCTSFPTFDTMYFLKGKNDWRVVVNLPEVNYRAKIRLEVCTNVGGSCFKFQSFNGFEPKCKQMTSIWEVLVLNETGKAVLEEFEVPTCCVCATN